MVTFTCPEQLRPLFFTPEAKAIYDLFFRAASSALRGALANPRWLGADCAGFTMILHTWNQRLGFHPHIHAIVPGAGLAADGRVVAVKSPGFLVPQPVLRAAFRQHFREGLARLRKSGEDAGRHRPAPDIDPALWRKDWGVHLQPFGDGKRAIQYLGAYVCRTAIADSRILDLGPGHVSFSWKDRAKGNARRTETLPGAEFVARYLRHVLPPGMRAIRRYGFCHAPAKEKRERVAFHTGRALEIGPAAPPAPEPARRCPCCGGPMVPVLFLPAVWKSGRSPPNPTRP